MEAYPFSKMPPPSGTRRNRNTPTELDPSFGKAPERPPADEPHIGRMTTFFVIALVSIPMLSIGAIITHGQRSGGGLNEMAYATVNPSVEVLDMSEEASLEARMLVAATPSAGQSQNLAFAPSNASQIDGIETLSLDAIDRSGTTASAIATGPLVFTNADGTHQVELPPESEAPILRSSADTQFHIFNVRPYSTATVLITWDVLGSDATAQEVIDEEAELAGMTVEFVEEMTGADNEDIVLAILNSNETQTRALLTVHVTDDGYAAAYLTAPVAHADAAFENFQSNVESIRFTG